MLLQKLLTSSPWNKKNLGGGEEEEISIYTHEKESK